MAHYIHQLPDWPDVTWQHERLTEVLAAVRNRQGRLLGRLEASGFQLQEDTMLETLSLDILKSSEIEGEELPANQVRSSITRRLGIDNSGLPVTDRRIEGVVEMMLNATQQYGKLLTKERLHSWHKALFSNNTTEHIQIDSWRDGPMQVVSGAMGKERVHFEAPDAFRLEKEMLQFLNWFNQPVRIDPVLKAGIAHLWFVTVHPFDDGNGRIARAITDMQLARADGSSKRFYSMSAQIQKERNSYYNILEQTQRGTIDITDWLLWFIDSLNSALQASEEQLSGVQYKTSFREKHRSVPLNERQHKMLNKLLDGFEGKLTSAKWGRTTHTSTDTALRDIQDLINKGLLEKEAGGGRSSSYRLKA